MVQIMGAKFLLHIFRAAKRVPGGNGFDILLDLRYRSGLCVGKGLLDPRSRKQGTLRYQTMAEKLSSGHVVVE